MKVGRQSVNQSFKTLLMTTVCGYGKCHSVFLSLNVQTFFATNGRPIPPFER